MDVYLSTVSDRLNAVMKQLTIIATVFLPLTFITRFVSQNFDWMDTKDPQLADVPCPWSGSEIVALLALPFFKRRGWF